MAAAEKYAEWIVANQAKKGTPEFETVARAYKAARAQEQSAPKPAESKPAEPAAEPTDWGREAALAGKAAFQGVASLPLAFADFQDMPKALAAKFVGAPYQSPSERANAALDSVTYSPKTAGERLTSDAIAGTAGAFVGGPARVMTGLAGGAGGLAAGGAREAGGGPVSQIIAALLASAGVGGATKAGKTLGEVVDSSFIPGGGKRAAVRATANIVDDKDAIAEALLRAKPGQTAAQAAAPTGSAEFAALEKIARENAPSRFQAIDDAQQASRAGRIREIAKTPEELAAAKATRKDIADPLYDAARSGGGINAQPVLAKIDRLINENPGNRELLTELKNLRAGLIANRKTGELHTDAQKLASVVDGMKSAMADEKNKFILGNLTELKDDLRAIIPGFKEADSAFAQASRPINKMVVGAELEKALTSGTGKERALAFTNSVENATRIPELQRKTGAQRFGSIGEVLDEAEMGKVKGVADEFRTDARVDELMRAGSPKVSSLYKGEMEKVSLPQMLTRPVMIMNALLRRAQGYGSQRTTDALSDYMGPEGVRDFGMALKDYSKDDLRKLMIEALMAGGRGGIAAQRGNE